MKFRKTQRSLLLLILIAGLIAGGVTASRVGVVRAASPQAKAVAPDATPLQIPDPVQLSTAFSKLAKQLEPSVVQVTSTIEEKSAQRRGNRARPDQTTDPEDLFRRFFGQDPFGDMPMPQRPRRAQGTGSGFIVDKNGYILTNNHVVEDATRVQVRLHDDTTQYNAKVIGTDPELDLAVIKIESSKPLAPVKIGNSDGVQVGDWAVAIGSPFGLDATVTAGIISALGRDLNTEGHQLQRFLQTDAAINPGNSGGPLLNIRGEVIGVNTMIATNTGASAGVGFALPINMAVNAYNQIIETGKVSRGAIGIRFQRDTKPELLEAYGAKSGVFVSEVTPGTPAARAGIKEGDIITAFDGKPVKDGDELVSRVSQTPVGRKVPITILRDNKTLNMTIEVIDRSQLMAEVRGGSSDTGGDRQEGQQSAKLGISVQNLRETDRDQMDFREQGGVLVSNVDSGSFAEEVGIQEGDVLVAINRQPVNSTDDVKRIAGTLKAGDPVAFKVYRSPGAGLRRRSPNQGQNAQWIPLFLAGTLPKVQ
ncbi:MAG: Do family serine endopeptidase [Acidobacteriota bacterium]